jgi:hypothetical protein
MGLHPFQKLGTTSGICGEHGNPLSTASPSGITPDRVAKPGPGRAAAGPTDAILPRSQLPRKGDSRNWTTG